MVTDIFDAYRILNQSVLQVIDDTVDLDILEVDKRTVKHRMVENPFSVAECYEKIEPVVVAHNIAQYTNRFYSIQMEATERCLLDILIHLNRDEVDLREFGGDLCV